MKTGKGGDLKIDDFTRRGDGPERAPRVYGSALVAAAHGDPRIVCLTADLAAATEVDLFRSALPERFVQLGIAEANMAGIAGGMARLGDIPFIHSFCVFATKRCYDQLSMQIAYPKLNVKVVGFLPGLTTRLGVSHQAIEDIAIMRAMPNTAIIEPSGPEQCASAVTAALAVDGPVYLRMPEVEQVGSFAPAPLEIGKAYVLRDGADGVIFASGAMVQRALAAAAELMRSGDSVAVVNLSSIKPLDASLVVELAAAKRIVVTAENHSIVGGLGSAVAELLLESGIRCGFQRVGVGDQFAEGGSTDFLFEKYGLSVAAIVSAFGQARRRFRETRS